MRKAMIRLAVAAMLPVAALMQGCEHKDLCYDHSHMTDLRVDFDWSAAPDADPRTMVVHFFRPDGSLYKRVEFTSATGGTARLEAGKYMMLFHNGEMETVHEKGERYGEYVLTCMSRSLLAPMGRDGDAPRPPHSENQPVTAAPEPVWAGTHAAIEVVAKTGGQAVTLKPSEATAEYTVEICNVENMSDGIELSAAITGMSPQYMLAEERHGGVPATIPVALEKVDGHTLVARFRAFGHCPEGELPHTFTVYTSSKVYYNYDISGQMHSASDPRHVYIKIDGLRLPEEGTGMSPDISGWEEIVEIDIPMN